MIFSPWVEARLARPKEPPLQSFFEAMCFLCGGIALSGFLVSYFTFKTLVMKENPDVVTLAWSITVLVGVFGEVVVTRVLWRTWPPLMRLLNKISGWLK